MFLVLVLFATELDFVTQRMRLQSPLARDTYTLEHDQKPLHNELSSTNQIYLCMGINYLGPSKGGVKNSTPFHKVMGKEGKEVNIAQC